MFWFERKQANELTFGEKWKARPSQKRGLRERVIFRLLSAGYV